MISYLHSFVSLVFDFLAVCDIKRCTTIYNLRSYFDCLAGFDIKRCTTANVVEQ